jgi:acetylornithine deacetylase
MTTIAAGDAVALTRMLVRIDSRNPALVPGAPGEGEIATALGRVLREWGFAVELMESSPGRPNVIARIGPTDGNSLMLNGHLDTVGVEGMTHPPFEAGEQDGKMFGRGSADMKSGVAAMCAAAARAAAAKALRCQVIVTAVTDEEFESEGTRAVVASGIRADAAIVTEPTRLAIAPAHRGFAWLELTVRGRAAHGSRYDIGVDAIRHAALVLAELDRLERDTLTARTHKLLGHASLHASTVEGGIGWSTYPDRCVVRIERRTLPGETADGALAEVHGACERVRAAGVALDASVELKFAQGPSDVAEDAPIVLALASAMQASGEEVRMEGLSAWTDAALLNDAGIPAICYGPGDISLAHSATEWVPVAEIERATTVLERVLRNWPEGR